MLRKIIIALIAAAAVTVSAASIVRNEAPRKGPDDLLENSFVIESLQEVSESGSAEGGILYDDAFMESAPQPTHLSGKAYLAELSRKDVRWHITDHRVTSGESLFTISRKFGVNYRHIVRYNDIRNPSKIKPGSTLGVPNRIGDYYTIRRGDSLERISRTTGTELALLKSANRMKGDKLIQGRELFIPGWKKPVIEAESTTTRRNKDVVQGSPKRRTTDQITRKNGEVRKTDKSIALHNRLNMTWPVRGPITSAFGMRRDPFSRKRVFHNGMDIGCVIGTPIRAAAEGKVIFAGWKEGYGNLVVIEHANEIITVYAHLDTIGTIQGAQVAQGEEIAKSGDTGTVTGPHLHFEIRKNYVTALNPGRILR
jgi:murein DD-endopeptidase MepM/ murein hydrolase activator NlpD